MSKVEFKTQSTADLDLILRAPFIIKAQLDKGARQGRAGWHREPHFIDIELRHLAASALSREDYASAMTYCAMLESRKSTAIFAI